MIITIASFVLIVVALLALLLQRVYSVIPQYELKRLAAKRDALAQALYRPASYGGNMRLLLRIMFVAGLTSGLMLLAASSSTWITAGSLAIILVLCVMVIPSIRLTVRLAQFAVLFSGVVSWLLMYAHGPLNFLTSQWYRFRPPHKHSGLYEKEDLVKLLAEQSNQPDNRILEEELQLASHLLQFGDKQAADIMKPRNELLLINETETIGPLLLDRLHQVGNGLALVFRGRKNNIVGTLRLEEALAARAGGQVSKFIQPNLLFVHEDYTLGQVLDAFRGSARPLAVVVNTAAEVAGAISLEDLLHQLVGPSTDKALENYSDPKVVAEYDPTKQPEKQPGHKAEEPAPEAKEPVYPSPDTTEVIK